MISSTATEQVESTHSSGGLWDYVSPSRLNLWLTCPRAFELRYVHGIRSRTSPSLFFGKQIHAALEQVYRHRLLDCVLPGQAVVARLEDGWNDAADAEDVAFRSADERDALREKACRLVLAYLAQVPEDEPRPLAVETMLETPIVDPETGEDLGIPLRGIVDLVLDDQQGPLICDFKTAASSQQPLEVCHEVQLGCYAVLFRALSGQKEGGLAIRTLVKTKVPQIIEYRFGPRSDEHLRRLFAVIRAYLEDLRRGDFLYRPGWTCRTCDFRSHCVSS